MFGRRVGITAGLVLAGAALFLIPGANTAWGRGVVIGRGFGGGYGYTHVTPYGNVSSYGYRSPYYGYRSYGYGYPSYGYGYGYPSYGYGWGGGFGYAPTYNNYYYPPTYSVQPQTSPGVPYVAGYAPSAPTSNTARVDIQVPANADLFIEGQKMTQTGARRSFVSPALEAGHKYIYTIKATWMEDGKPVTQQKQVTVQAGDRQSLLFLGDGDGKPAATTTTTN
jgi:uncharacterized protein (TIGR03000 family)